MPHDVLKQVVLLLTLLGGAVYITFEITWTISNEQKEMTAHALRKQAVILYD